MRWSTGRVTRLSVIVRSRGTRAGGLALAAALAVTLAACGGTSPAAAPSPSGCHSLVSCLKSKIPFAHPRPRSGQGSSGPVTLGPEALGPLAGHLSASAQQIVLGAMDGLAAGPRSQVIARLDGLSSVGATSLGTDLTQVFAASTPGAQAYAAALLGAPGTSAGAVSALTQDEMNQALGAFSPLPQELSQGDSQIASFFSQILSTTVPHIEGLLENGIAQVPAQDQPLVLANAARSLAAATPTDLEETVAYLEDSQAGALATRTAYQAGYDCGSIFNTCTTFDKWMLSVSGLKTMPALIQQDAVDCVLLPVCSQVEYQGVLAWIEQEAVNSQAQSAIVSTLSAEMEANNFATNQAWIEAM